MAKYKVTVRSMSYVEADSPDEALEKVEDGDFIYSEELDSKVEEVSGFFAHLEGVI